MEAGRIFNSMEEDDVQNQNQQISFQEFASWSARRALYLGLIGKEPVAQT